MPRSKRRRPDETVPDVVEALAGVPERLIVEAIPYDDEVLDDMLLLAANGQRVGRLRLAWVVERDRGVPFAALYDVPGHDVPAAVVEADRLLRRDTCTPGVSTDE